jgi:hypothetical protein
VCGHHWWRKHNSSGSAHPATRTESVRVSPVSVKTTQPLVFFSFCPLETQARCLRRNEIGCTTKPNPYLNILCSSYSIAHMSNNMRRRHGSLIIHTWGKQYRKCTQSVAITARSCPCLRQFCCADLYQTWDGSANLCKDLRYKFWWNNPAVFELRDGTAWTSPVKWSLNAQTLREKRTGHEMCAALFSTAVVRKVFRSNKYLASYGRDARRNARGSLRKVSVLLSECS